MTLRLDIKGADILLIGDPHLGKRFETGVPLHRRGEREAMQWAEFERLLWQAADAIVVMGDLFDQFVVSNAVVKRAADLLIKAAIMRGVKIAVLPGNHDLSRDRDRVSSFELFAAIVGEHAHVAMQDRPELWRVGDAQLMLCPWSPWRTSSELVAQAPDAWTGKIDLALGHWDLEPVAGEANLVPIGALQSLGVTRAATGHDHTQRTIVRNGVHIDVVGSMMPYSHAEDREGRLYVTLTLAELKEALWSEGADAFRMKAVRVALAPGEQLDGTFDCLQVTTCMRDGAVAEEVDTNVQFEAFDFDGLFAEHFRDVRADVACAVRERLNERAAAA